MVVLTDPEGIGVYRKDQQGLLDPVLSLIFTIDLDCADDTKLFNIVNNHKLHYIMLWLNSQIGLKIGESQCQLLNVHAK